MRIVWLVEVIICLTMLVISITVKAGTSCVLSWFTSLTLALNLLIRENT